MKKKIESILMAMVTLIMFLFLMLSCDNDPIKVIVTRVVAFDELFNSQKYYYTIMDNNNIFNKEDECQLIGYIVGNNDTRYYINSRTRIYNDTLYVIKRNVINTIYDYRLNIMYRDSIYIDVKGEIK